MDSIGETSPQVVDTHEEMDSGFDPVTFSTDEEPIPLPSETEADQVADPIPAATYRTAVNQILPSVLDEVSQPIRRATPALPNIRETLPPSKDSSHQSAGVRTIPSAALGGNTHPGSKFSEEGINGATPAVPSQPLFGFQTLSSGSGGNSDPVADDEVAWTGLNQTIMIYVLIGDTDQDGGDILSVASASGATKGTATPQGDYVSYTPNANFTSGSDTFSYTVTDGNGGTDIGEVTVNMVNVTGWTVEWKDSNGQWHESPNGEVLWADDELRWTASATLTSPAPAHYEFAKQDWEEYEQSGTNWSTFTDPGIPAYGNPGVGVWAIMPLVNYNDFDGNQSGFVARPAVAEKAMVVPKVKLHFVTFENEHEITGDPPSSGPAQLYDTQHWLDGNLDGDATDPGDHQWPVAYTRSTTTVSSTLNLTAQIVLAAAWNGPVQVRADGPGNIDIPATVDNVNGTTVTINASASNPFPATIKHYDNFDLTWEISFNGGTTWKNVGTSSNDLYLTLGNPIPNPLYHTVVHIGSHEADGQNAENPTITAIWNYFDGAQVKEVDGTPLIYYNTYDNNNIDTESLLRHNEGQCHAWISLFLDVLEAQGIDRTDDHIALVPTVASNADGIIVNDWQFAAGGGTAAAALPGIPQWTAIFPYLNLVKKDAAGNYIDLPFNAAKNGYSWLFSDVTDQAGDAGQNNADPASLFFNHHFAQLDVGMGKEWFDPSYGTKYTGATEALRELDFDNSQVAGYFRVGTADVQEGVVNIDLNGDGDKVDSVQWLAYLYKQNTIGVREIEVALNYPQDY